MSQPALPARLAYVMGEVASRAALVEIDPVYRTAGTRSRDTYLSAQYRRLKPRRGHKKALGAVRHSIIVAAWHMLTTGEIYRDAGGDHFARLDPDKQTRRLVAQLERLGHIVTLQEAAA